MKIAIVDDEKKQREQLNEYVLRYLREIGQVAECALFSSSIDFVSDYTHYDIILLDIEMPDLNGMDAARKIRRTDTEAVIIFITRMAQYAICGYEVDALDFMVKPVSYFNLSVKFEKAFRSIPRKKICSVISDGTTYLLDERDIFYIEGSNQHVIYHTFRGNYKVYKTLKAVESTLGKEFSRCNNSFIVNMRYLTCINGTDAVVCGERLPISRGRKKLFMEDVNRYLGGL